MRERQSKWYASGSVYLLRSESKQSRKSSHSLDDQSLLLLQVNVPKTKRAYCKDKNCRKHTVHKVTQYKTGKASLYAQGEVGLTPSLVIQGDVVTLVALAIPPVFHHGSWRYRLSETAGKRRYDRKQAGYGGQTKPVFHKKVRSCASLQLVSVRVCYVLQCKQFIVCFVYATARRFLLLIF